MNATKLLIDTNILIALEDPGYIEPVVAEFSRRCHDEGIVIHVHPATLDDFARDANASRREASKTRHAKFPSLDHIPSPSLAELERVYGPVRSPNDLVDVELLHALAVNAVDILVTQDTDLHRRVRGTDMEDRVLTISDVVAWLRTLQESENAYLPHVEDIKAYALDPHDEIFRSLSVSYPSFGEWWDKKCARQHRPCWVVGHKSGRLDGLVVRKRESGAEIGLPPSSSVLKLCTFKVAEHAQGTKIGELLLKKAIWYAQGNNYDAIYLTTFPAQTMLIDLMTRYGFEIDGTLKNGEIRLVKLMQRGPLIVKGRRDVAEVRRDYPRFSIESPVELFVIPIRWRYFRQLFPEAATIESLPLFPEAGSLAAVEAGTAGNTIRKVYISRSRIRAVQPGDVLFFYLSKDKSALHSQCLTTVGVVESVRRAHDFRELSRLVAGRSAYSQEDLAEMVEGDDPLTVIDFLLVGHLSRPVPIAEMLKERVLRAAPQSISRLGKGAGSLLRPARRFGFDI